MAVTLRSIAALCLLLALSATLATAATTPPTQCGGSCLWQTLGFNPFTRWNVFSLSTIGTSDLPFGGTIEGTVASVGSSWFKAISIHTGEPASAWSATAGGNFTLLGGSVLNGGVEAGENVVIESADVAGDVTAVNGAAKIGSAETGVTIQGKTSARTEVSFSAGSNSNGGVATTNDLKLSVDLEAVATYFKQQSEEYARAMDHNIDLGATSVFISENGNDIIVELHDGLNFLTLDAEQLVAAQRIQLNGGAESVLVINVAGKNITLNSLDVFANGMTDAVTSGRVLLNLYQAEFVTIEWGSGAFSTLAPLAATVYKSGAFSGSWVVGSLVTQWQGGVEFGNKPWAAVCAASEDCGESNPGEVSEQIAENV